MLAASLHCTPVGHLLPCPCLSHTLQSPLLLFLCHVQFPAQPCHLHMAKQRPSEGGVSAPVLLGAASPAGPWRNPRALPLTPSKLKLPGAWHADAHITYIYGRKHSGVKVVVLEGILVTMWGGYDSLGLLEPSGSLGMRSGANCPFP